jgi:hypothetical protein
VRRFAGSPENQNTQGAAYSSLENSKLLISIHWVEFLIAVRQIRKTADQRPVGIIWCSLRKFRPKLGGCDVKKMGAERLAANEEADVAQLFAAARVVDVV